jgi:hypothetical protein
MINPRPALLISRLARTPAALLEGQRRRDPAKKFARSLPASQGRADWTLRAGRHPVTFDELTAQVH